MASIVKRKNKYSVVYRYIDESGKERQRWETFDNNADAKKRKAQIEYQQETNTFIPPSVKTLAEFLDSYMAFYGVNKWAPSTYEGHKGLIGNYIVPLIGDLKLEDITPLTIDTYYTKLKSVKQVGRPGRPGEEFLTPHIIWDIHKVLRNAFNLAVKWELIYRNPAAKANLSKAPANKREIWTPEQLFQAIQLCEGELLALQMNLAFACSLRMGEMLGLTWDCVDIAPESIENGTASIYIEKELQRINRNALEKVGEESIIKKFPTMMGGGHNTILVLKTPKTRTSVRRVYLPKSVAEMLIKRREEVEELKSLLGDEYRDYDLVFCSPGGTPMEGSAVNREFSKLIREHNLPKVVFHSLRHTSTTAKLKLSGGDIKAVQGDTGHAQATMVTEQYSHILDDDRKVNAERMERAFYSKQEEAIPQRNSDPLAGLDEAGRQALLLKLLTSSPELTAVLQALLNAS